MPGVTGSDVPRSFRVLAGQQLGDSDVASRVFTHGPDIDINSRFNEVGPGYLPHDGSAAHRRDANSRAADTVGSPKVAIVNEAFAKKFNLGRDAVGKRMASVGAEPTPWISRSLAWCRTRSTAR